MSSTVEAKPSATSQTVPSSHDLLVPLRESVLFSLMTPKILHKTQKREERERDRDVRVVVPGVEGKGLTGSVFVAVVGDEKGELVQYPETNKQDAHLLSTEGRNTDVLLLLLGLLCESHRLGERERREQNDKMVVISVS